MINKKNLKKYAGTAILVAALSAGGIAIHNHYTFELNIDNSTSNYEYNVFNNNGTIADNTSTNESVANIEENGPIYVTPRVFVGANGVKGLMVPQDYAIYNVNPDYPSAGMISFDEGDDSIVYYFPEGYDFTKASYMGVRREFLSYLLYAKQLKDAVTTGNLDKYEIVIPEVTQNGNQVGLIVPTSYGVYNFDPSARVGMLSITENENTVMYSGGVGETLTGYYGFKDNDVNVLRIAEQLENEMRSEYAKQYGQTTNR